MQPPNSHHLEAAEGWLELGNHVAAFHDAGDYRSVRAIHSRLSEPDSGVTLTPRMKSSILHRVIFHYGNEKQAKIAGAYKAYSGEK
jgi:hypothetical protein